MSSKQRNLIAIADPAPSIPAKFRLYHGGTSKRGYLVTGAADSGSYLGDHVYFSSVKAYARQYLRKRKHGRGRLFVIDARYLPRGARVLRTNEHAGWPPRYIEGRLFDLIDMTWDLRGAIRALEGGGARSLLDPTAPVAVRDFVEYCVAQVRFLRRASQEDNSAPVITRRLLQAFRRLALRIVGPARAATLAQLSPLDDDFPSHDRWDNLALFLLDACGTLDLSKARLRSALNAYRRQWLAEFSVPLNATNLDAVRQEGVAATLDEAYGGTARSGMIVLVPGNVRVLDDRHRAGTQRRSVPE